MNRSHSASEITERPHAPSWVAAFMSAHSKTPYITPGMGFPSGKGGSMGAQGAASVIYLAVTARQDVVKHLTTIISYNFHQF